MPIRIMPTIGQCMIINKSWFASNEFFSQYFNLKPAKVYEILRVSIMDEENPDEWGISAVMDIETSEITDIELIPELEQYWCLFDKEDSIRIIEM